MVIANLIMTAGPAVGQRHDLSKAKVVLGRHPDCEIVLDAGAVSRQHAQVVADGPHYYVEDLKSRNGTFVNDDLVAGRRELQAGDIVRICDLVFRFDDGRGAAADTHPTFGMESSRAVVVDDDEQTPSSSKIMSKLEVSDNSGLRLEANPLTKLKAVLEITSNLSKSISVEHVLPKLLDSLFKIFLQADRGFVVLREGASNQLVPKAIKFRRPEDDETIRISRTIVDEAMNGREAILSADATSDERFQMSQSIADFRIRSMMCAPLLDSEGNALGVIQIDTVDQRSRFKDDDLEVLVGVAAPAGLAIENAQLHEDIVRQQRLQRDLEMAHRVQKGFLPMQPPEVPGYNFFDYYVAAYEVGGDYYDYVILPDGRLAVVLGDVSGKGISAALLTAKLSAEMRFYLAVEPDPAAAVNRMNRAFSDGRWEDRFVTLILAVLEPASGDLSIVNAGHLPPLFRRDGSTVEMPGTECAGLPLGVDADFPYEAAQLQLAPGDYLAVFTDGVSEAMNPAGELYGMEKLKDRFADNARSADELGRRILDDVTNYVAGRPQSDDMCLICLGREP